MLVREWLYESASVKAQHVSSKNLQNIPGQAAKCLPQKSGEMEGKRDLHALRNHLFESQNLKLLEEQITATNSGFVDIRELARFTACIAFITIQSLHSSQKVRFVAVLRRNYDRPPLLRQSTCIAAFSSSPPEAWISILTSNMHPPRSSLR
jgi:hypothetical protein